MTNEEVQACLQPVQTKYAKLEILNQNDYIVDELSGVVTDGSYNIDNDSAIRRTCNITFVLSSKLVPSISSPLWINKRFRLWTGIMSLITNSIVWFDKGIYIINDPSLDIQISDRTISINGLDKMCFLTNDVSGQLSDKVVIEPNTPISDAIKSTVQTFVNENKLLIDTSPYVVPFKIEKDITSTVYDVVKEIADLFLNWKFYYDINGNFVFERIKNHLSDPIIFDFSVYPNSIKSISSNIKYSNIKNYYKIIGKLLDTGVQYKSELYLRDSNYPSNSFTIEKMNEDSPRKFVKQEDKYYTQEQCDSRLEYEVLQHTNFAERISISCIPLEFLDIDQIVYINSPEYKIEGKYCISKISCGLKYDSLMGIEAYKIYE